MSLTIALTGATGFIGGALTPHLLENGWTVRALVRPSGRPKPLHASIHVIEGALDDAESLGHLLSGADAVVHCAGAVRGVTPQDFARVNVDGLGRLAELASSQIRKPRFLSLSSLAAREPAISPYASSKREGETALARAAGDMTWIALRPPAVYGPGEREMRPLFDWMMRGLAFVLGPPTAHFSLLYVDDLATAVCQWLRQSDCPRGVFELHDGQEGGYAWGDVLAIASKVRGKPVRSFRIPPAVLGGMAQSSVLLSRVLGLSPMLTPGKVRELTHSNWVCDNKHLCESLKWTPRIAFEEGLRRTLGLAMPWQHL